MSRTAFPATPAPPRPALRLVVDGEAAEPVAPPWLTDVATELADLRELWAPQVCHDPERRFYERLVVTEEYDAWLVGWCPGQAITAHDHGESAGAVVVTEGRLVELRWTPEGALRSEELEAGDEISIAPGEVHAVANLGDARATSIHVYSPPLSSMRWFDGASDPERAREEDVLVHRSHAVASVEP